MFYIRLVNPDLSGELLPDDPEVKVSVSADVRGRGCKHLFNPPLVSERLLLRQI